MQKALMTTYNPLPVKFSHGKGVRLWDLEGREYIDALAGIAVTALGHCHPAISEAICEQACQLLHVSNLYQIEEQQQLAEKLCRLSGMDRAFFANSGAEANEAAIKLCRLYGRQKGIEKPNIIVMEKAFHGRTLACLSASGSRKVQAGFEPLVQGFIRAPYNDIAALEVIAQNRQDVVAVMAEPIQGEGGICVPETGYLEQLQDLCHRHGWLLVLDEIQTGVGRTGKFYAYQHEKCTPDLVTTAKALGNGIPIGACLAKGQAAELFKPGNHGSTFGGNPFACHVASTVIDVIEQNNLVAKAAKQGDVLLNLLREKLAQAPTVVDIRGKGLMIGIELTKPAREILHIGLEKGILFNVTADNVLRLLPPLVISTQDTEEIATKVAHCIAAFN